VNDKPPKTELAKETATSSSLIKYESVEPLRKNAHAVESIIEIASQSMSVPASAVDKWHNSISVVLASCDQGLG